MSRATGSLLARVARHGLLEQGFSPHSLAALQQVRHGMGGVPEYFGKKSPYTDGTDFLGTPADHLELTKKRPLAPDVFELGGGTHYKFQPNAISSILNRVTGVVLSLGAAGLAGASLAGCAPAAIALVKAHPLLLYPTKAGISFSLGYHYLGGIRHQFWDHGKIGKQSEHNDKMELSWVQASSKAMIAAGGIIALAGAAYSI